jgi:hypothetical protein
MASRKNLVTIKVLIALALLGFGMLQSCAHKHSMLQQANVAPYPPAPRAGMEGPPPVPELDELLADAPRGISQASQVVSMGSDYSPAGSGHTGSNSNCIEPDGTDLNLRAYNSGDYTYGLFSQEVGDGVMGGGRDDEIPLSSLIEVSPCAYGGGRDDEIPLSFFLGFADFSIGAWRWFGPFGDTEEAVSLYTEDMKNRFKSPMDIFYICVLTTSGPHMASSLPPGGVVGPLPFNRSAKAASAAEAPYGVLVHQLVTEAGLGDGTVPSVVTGVSASMDVMGPVTVTWEANPDPEVTSYLVYRTIWDPPAGWTPPEYLGEVLVPGLQYYDGTALAFVTYIYEVRAVNGIGTGGPGTDAAGPPRLVGSPLITPESGVTGATVQFTASVMGSDPITYAWDFAGGGTPNTSTEVSPSVVLGAMDEYFVTVDISNSFGSQNDGILFRVTPAGTPSWHTQTVISAGSVGQHASLACIDGSFAAMTCSSDAGLQFVMSSDYYWGRTWNAPVIVEAGGGIGDYCSLNTVNGVPAVSYFGWTINYAKASTYWGTSWNTPVNLAPLGGQASGTSLAVINGYPAVCYFNDTPVGGLKYIQSNDIDGATWSPVVTVDDTNLLTGWFSSLAQVNGNPAIAYYGSALKYVRATDAYGGAWGTPIVVDDGSTKGNFASLEVVAGIPAIAYYEYLGMGNGARVLYVRAKDPSGSAWGTPVEVDFETGAGTGSWISLAVIGGKPSVSYASDQTSNIMYTQALDSVGAVWGAPEVVDSTGNCGGYTSLINLHGNPAIAYWNFYNDDLMFACKY